VSWQVVVNTGMPSALALPPGNGGPGVVAAGVTADVVGAAGAGGNGVSVATMGTAPPAVGSGAAGSLVAGDSETGYVVEVASRAMVVLRGARP